MQGETCAARARTPFSSKATESSYAGNEIAPAEGKAALQSCNSGADLASSPWLTPGLEVGSGGDEK